MRRSRPRRWNTRPGWGAPRPAHVDPTGVLAVQFQMTASGAAYDFWIDDVVFTCN